MKKNTHNKCLFGENPSKIFCQSFFPLIVFLFLFQFNTFSQVTKIVGKVIDKETKEPIPFANIFILNTSHGTLTDFEGKYSIEFRDTKHDSIRASLLGYAQVTKSLHKSIFQNIDFELSPVNEVLPEVVIKYKGNPADAIMDSIVKYKQKNTFRSFNTYQYDVYTKVQLDANNVSERISKSNFMQPFKFVLNNVDTSVFNGKSYLPVMISETKSHVYERKAPKSKKEIIEASRISGVNNTNITRFLGSMSQEIDVYRNFNELFEKNFVSPIADFGHDYYKYYLVDSSFINKRWCYHIMFKPKRKQELTYTGSLWVNDTSYAIVQIDLRIADDANINFVNDLSISQRFTELDGKLWMKNYEKLLVDFNVLENAKKLLGVYGHKTVFYDQFKFGSIDDDKVFKQLTDVTINENAVQNYDAYWDTIRPELLSERESNIYEMVDSIKNIPRFQHALDFIYGLTGGYFPWGKIEIGPWYKMISYNELEQARFRFGGRTTIKLSKKFRIGGFVAYGTHDAQFKYGGDFLFMFNKSPRRRLFISYKYDLEQLGTDPNGWASDNIVSSFLNRGPIDKLTFVREYKMYYEHEWYTGLINKFVVQRRELFPLTNSDFVIYPEKIDDTVNLKSITTTELGVDIRLSFNETYIDGRFNRISIESQYPIITLQYRFGLPDLFSDDFSYHKVSLNINQWFNLGTIGWSRFNINMGKIWGKLPYPLLKIHEGNETWVYANLTSNLVDYYEFISDQYITLSYTHHFDGLLFNKIPLLRKLKWREIARFNGFYGTLSQSNKNFSKFPVNTHSLGKEPYMEVGAGIENIFKFVRIEAIWRLTHLHDAGYPEVNKFGLFASLYFSF